ncbi:hypothetical protein [Nakamurella sp.]|uniref:hypothetical protein n=1 Tax=Nakamurella sp. TaxID=1869182 RepID=UPI003784A4B8
MDGKTWQVWLPVGLGVVLAGLVAALALGVLTEALILLATVGACGLSLIPLLVDRRIRRSPGSGPAIIPDGW